MGGSRLFAQTRVREDLGLSDAAPLVEWHTWTAAPLPPVQPQLVGWAEAHGPHSSLALPAGTQVGDTMLVVAVIPSSVTDARLVQVAGSPTYCRLLTGTVTALDPIAVAGGSDFSRSAVLVVRGPLLSATLLTGLHSAGVVVPATAGPGVALLVGGTGSTVHGALGGIVAPWTVAGSSASNDLVDTLAGWYLGDAPTVTITNSMGDGETYALLVRFDVAEPEAGSSGRWERHDDRTAALISYSITAHRRAPTVDTQPSTCRVLAARALFGDDLPQVGDRIRLALAEDLVDVLGLHADDRPRFTGQITDPVVSVGPDHVEVTATGTRARLGVIGAGEVAWPQEDVGARITRALAAAVEKLPTLEVGPIDPGGYPLLARPADPQPVAALVDRAAASSGSGQLVEQRSGRLDWHGPDHRRGAVAAFTIAGNQHIRRPFSWSQSVQALVTIARISYGDPAGEVVVVDADAADPETGVGPYDLQIATDLVDGGDAASLGADIVGRRSRPTWEISELNVNLARRAADDPTLLAALLSVQFGDLIGVTDLDAARGPVDHADLFVEGWTETGNPRDWSISLACADPALAGVALQWEDLEDGLQWLELPADLRWLDFAGIDADDPALHPDLFWDAGGAAPSAWVLELDGGAADTTAWDDDTPLDGGTP